MKTRIICLLLAMVMVLGMLVSCGEGEGTGNNGGNKPGTGNTPPDQGDPGIYDTYWKETPINFQLTEASDSKQFTAGTRRYYAGGDTASTKIIDVNIRARNSNAERAAKVKINYSYLPDTKANDWSASVDTILKNSTTYTAGKSIDIYCNFVYDLACAAVKGCFANLKANTPSSSASYGTGKNFFAFAAEDFNYDIDPEDYFNSEASGGYFYQYMLSLTLSNDKLYCLGSDYCTDLVRAFHVVPVNIELMNGIDVTKLPTFDDITREADMTNIEFFYEAVWAGHWNYDTLLKFSKAVYQDAGTGVADGVAGADITDVLGFGISGGGGLPASGILYTSSVQIVNKELLTADRKAQILADTSDDVGADRGLAEYIAGDYLITYPDSNADFTAYADALNRLFELGKNQGVCVVDTGDSMNAIRSSFVAGRMLFGSIISLGSLEDSDYQGMRSGSGFGIVPVPVYKAGDEYQTFVHNNARIIAIARLTDRFEQISAYLDYQSRNSAGILEMYYNNELAQSLEGEVGNDNARMLTYIRNHVRNVFDKTYEDVMGEFNGATDKAAELRRWHEILRINKFQIPNMGTYYSERKDEKSADLKNVIKAWNNLK